MRTRRSARRPGRALAGILLAAALALTACSGGSDTAGSSSDKAAVSEAEAAAPEGTGNGGRAAGSKAASSPELTTSGIIRTASLTVQVKDVLKALDKARTTAETAGGYVSDETTTRDEKGNERTRVVLRVPTERYDEVLTALEGAGKLLDRAAQAQDVTDQVVDVESRIQSQRASVARIRELMDRATQLSDVVTLEGELSTREADLEALLAQQASLKDRTSMATITLSLSETPVEKTDDAEKDDDPGFLDALAGGWNAFMTMLRWIAVALGAVLPFAAVAVLILLVWLRLLRPRLPRRRAAAPATATPGPLPTARPAPEAPHTREPGERD